MSADLLSRAVAKLRETEGQSVTVFRVVEDDYNTNHMIAACDGAHAGLTDRYGCCQDCTFIGGYDPVLVAIVAVLLQSRPALATWLEALADKTSGLTPADFATLADDKNGHLWHAVSLARTILGEATS